MFRVNRNDHLDFQRNEVRFIDFDIVAGHTEGVEMQPEAGFEFVIERLSADAMNCDKNGAPAASPTKSCCSTLDPRIALRDIRVILGGDSPLLRAKGTRCALPHALN